MIQYQLLQRRDADELDTIIKEMSAEGWKVQGQVSAVLVGGGLTWYVTMAKAPATK
ncbi:hypothetical protein CPT_Percy31 [Caulobacter phage Percy]|uniref:DUF1737 domain-containing protein n=1 Tax=Caulobacter phage Percy TaxID=1701809 RepID=A0A0M4R449_9CAUD|nr:hypothetical protein CPT_Percy31 [Caulobacter phage Percy]ALF01665.1 hypothetical protein CPT_Percy31 [Caulobacter phage Percy]